MTVWLKQSLFYDQVKDLMIVCLALPFSPLICTTFGFPPAAKAAAQCHHRSPVPLSSSILYPSLAWMKGEKIREHVIQCGSSLHKCIKGCVPCLWTACVWTACLWTACVCVCVSSVCVLLAIRTIPPPACRAGAAAADRTDWRAPVGLCGHYLAVHCPQQ
jgi:hypothetical protein